MAKAVSEEERLLEFLYASPVGLIEIDASGTITMINPHAMKHLLPISKTLEDSNNLFAMLDGCAPELRNMFDAFAKTNGTICDGHRILVDLRRQDGLDKKVLACTLVKLDANRAIACISDVTIQVAQERRLKQAETWFSSIMNDINDYAVVSLTRDGYVDAVNESWAKQTGYRCDSLIGRLLADVFPTVAGDGNLGVVERLRLTDRDGWYLDESWHSRQDGSRYWCQRLLAARADSDGQISGYTMVLRDIAPQKYDTDDLRRLLTQDHLTGTANRARFQNVFEREKRVWQESGIPFSLIMLDIDHFKRVNDTYGHAAGDMVLKSFAAIVSGAIRPADLLARLGGEEFAVVLPATNLAGAAEIAERIRAFVSDMRVATPFGDLAITVSLGCATVRHNEDLLRSADDALYTAKRNGRNRVELNDRAVAAA